MQRLSPPATPDPSVGGDDASTVLDRIRTELVDLHAAAIDLQLRLGPALDAAAGDAAVLRAAQTLDLLSQALDGLATFTGAVGRCGLGSGRFDAAAAAAQVKLDGLSSRLAGQGPSDVPSASFRHGDFELL